ncbi:MAG: hypothetical protein ACR2PO_11330 [Methyloligellaceae bacterium]
MIRAQSFAYVVPVHPQTGLEMDGHEPASGTRTHFPGASSYGQFFGARSHHSPSSHMTLPITRATPPHDLFSPTPYAGMLSVTKKVKDIKKIKRIEVFRGKYWSLRGLRARMQKDAIDCISSKLVACF